MTKFRFQIGNFRVTSSNEIEYKAEICKIFQLMVVLELLRLRKSGIKQQQKDEIPVLENRRDIVAWVPW